MDKKVIATVVDKYANGTAKQQLNSYLKDRLYPDAFQGEYAWSNIEDLLEAHDTYVKGYVTAALEELLGNL